MKNKKPQFLSNEPLGDDLFEGKSQEKTAEIICNILKDKRFQIIGIDGAWGTGKSNLVKIIEKRIKEKEEKSANKTNFFVYDVWGHQEDEQRRAILEELTLKITDEKKPIVQDVDKWRKKFKLLVSKEKETISKKKPVLSLGIIFSLISLLVIPITNALANDNSDYCYKYIFYSIPLLILIVAYLYNLLTVIIKKRKFKVWMFKKACWKLFELYQRDKIENTTYERISEDEPSVRKFRDWMRDIDSDISPNSLVIVFDNFDRLPEKKIIDLWSSINIFFSEEKYKHIKVIIPFDREHIKKSFEYIGDSKYSEDYINKTFDIVYRVSKPILSNWKEFFRTKWMDAFGSDYDETEYSRVIQVYNTLNPENTPREIIAFINEIVSLKLLFQDEIPMRYMAIFILKKEELLENSTKVLEIGFLDGLANVYSSDEQLPKYLTALIYQLDPEKSLDIVYSKTILDALNRNDSKKLESISKLPGFINILDSVLPEVSSSVNAILVIDNLEDSCYGSAEKKQIVWFDLYNKARISVQEEHKVANYQKILLRRLENDHKVLWLKKILQDYYESKNFKSKDFSVCIDVIDKYLKENKIEINVFDYLVEREVKTEDFIEFLNFKKNEYPNYKIETDYDALDYHLSEIQDLSTLEKINYVPYLKEKCDFERYQDSLFDKIKGNTSSVKTESLLFEKLKEVCDKPIKIGDYLTDSQIYTFFNSSDVSSDFYYDLIAMRLSRFTDFSYATYFQTALNSNDSDIAEKVSQVVEYYVNFGDFLLGIEKFSDSPLYKKIAQNLVEKSYGISRANIKSILNKFDLICNKGGINGYKLINRLNSWGSKDITLKDVEQIPNNFFYSSTRNDSSLSKRCNELKIESFKNLSKDEWIKIYSNLTSSSFIVVECLKYDIYTKNQLDAFKEVIIDKVNTGSNLTNHEKYENIINQIYNIDKRYIKNLFNEIRDKFISTIHMNNDLFDYFGEWLFKYSQLSDIGQNFEKIFPVSILSQNSCINILIDNKKNFKSVLKNSNTENFTKTLKKKAKKVLRVKNLANELGIKIGFF